MWAAEARGFSRRDPRVRAVSRGGLVGVLPGQRIVHPNAAMVDAEGRRAPGRVRSLLRRPRARAGVNNGPKSRFAQAPARGRRRWTRPTR
uniref:Uncharacterized protein n=1 Tax=Plectus sambesii TaxID=2011161 RepID=A0A914V6D3_9BILA